MLKIKLYIMLMAQIFIILITYTTFAQEQVFDGIQFVQISAQPYQFGSTGSQVGRTMYEHKFEMPTTHTFWMSKYEITQAQWIAIMNSNPSTNKGLGPVDRHPVESVSWHDVQEFINRLNTLAGGDYYRLPTEAEWEYVAKGNTESSWFFGDNPLDLGTYAYRDDNPYPRARGGKLPNSFGLHDLYGNVYEWVEDWYVIERGPHLEACPPKEGTYKVLRGGSNASADRYLRSASRNFALPTRRSWKVGFRLVRVEVPADDYYRTGDLCLMGEGVDETDALIFLDNRNYIKCFGGLTIGADFMNCAFPLFNSLSYSLRPQDNKMLGVQSTDQQDQSGHSYLLDQIGAYLGYTSAVVLTVNEVGPNNLWQNTGTADNEYCYMNGEVLNWQQTPACNGGLNGGNNVISSFRLSRNRANNDCNNGEEGIFFVDADGDGFGDSQRQTNRCNQFISLSRVGGDCNDQNPAINPNQTESCNGVDDNCDDLIDNDPSDGSLWYRDGDSDSFGHPNTTKVACNKPDGYVANSNDCNDQNEAVKPGVNEVCNGVDDNCDDLIDNEPSDGVTWYQDADGDAFGHFNTTTVSCNRPDGYVVNSTDCNDQNESIKPGANELCNGVDDNCDDLIDNEPSDGTTWYRDADGDGFGHFNTTKVSCNLPDGYVANSSDCNDQNGSIKPGVNEVCNGIDDNCDDLIDNEPSDGTTYYRDADGDSFGHLNTTKVACNIPAGYVVNSTDCNDQNEAVKPGVNEICNGVDDNCDDLIDNEPSDGTTYYRDADGDGFGQLNTTNFSCNLPDGYVVNSTDCNDQNESINPGVNEVCNGLDDNCDGLIDNEPSDGTTWYRDADGDGFGTADTSTIACTQPDGYVNNTNDCNDDNPERALCHLCNGISIDSSRVCDGAFDCVDRSDEENCVSCGGRSINFYNNRGYHTGFQVISEGVFTYELKLVSDVHRENRVRVTFGQDCSVTVESLDRHNNMCYDHNLEPCDIVEEVEYNNKQNCMSLIRWYYLDTMSEIGERVYCQ